VGDEASARLLTRTGERPTVVRGVAALAGAALAPATKEEEGPGWAGLGRWPRRVGPAQKFSKENGPGFK
jgi:hypothetical protein